MLVCHGLCEPSREFAENLIWGYKKRPEGEKRKVVIQCIFLIYRQYTDNFFSSDVAPTLFFCGRDCIETHMWFKLHPLPFFSVVEITSGNLCGYNYSDSCINT